MNLPATYKSDGISERGGKLQLNDPYLAICSPRLCPKVWWRRGNSAFTAARLYTSASPLPVPNSLRSSFQVFLQSLLRTALSVSLHFSFFMNTHYGQKKASKTVCRSGRDHVRFCYGIKTQNVVIKKSFGQRCVVFGKIMLSCRNKNSFA